MQRSPWMAVGLLVACGGPEPCEPLDPDACGPEGVCEFNAEGTRCRSGLREGAGGLLDPCSRKSPCSNGYVCLRVGCVEGEEGEREIGFSTPSSRVEDNGCLPLCAEPTPYDRGGTGSRCIEFERQFGAPSHGWTLTTDLIDQVCSAE